MCVLRIPVKDTVSIQFNNYMYHTKNEKKNPKNKRQQVMLLSYQFYFKQRETTE